jgi:hypothetical protein
MRTELKDDADTMPAVTCLFGHTPDTVEEKAAQINIALSAVDSVMAAAAVFDQAKDCQVPKTVTLGEALRILETDRVLHPA